MMEIRKERRDWLADIRYDFTFIHKPHGGKQRLKSCETMVGYVPKIVMNLQRKEIV